MMKKFLFNLRFSGIILLLLFGFLSAGCFNFGYNFQGGGPPPELDFSLFRVDPPVAVNRGSVPVTITLGERGLNLSRFKARAEITLSLTGPATIPAEDLVIGEEEATCTFDCTGQPIGDYNLYATDGEASTTLPLAFFLRGNIQSAIGQASALYAGECLIKAYLPPELYNTDTEFFPIIMLTGVNLIGPGEGTLTPPAGRNGLNAVLDAEGTGGVIEIPFTVSTCAITGLEITGGYVEHCGGGIDQYADDYFQTDITISKNFIHDNTAGDYGGGVCIENWNSDIPEPLVSPLEITYNIFDYNSAYEYGGGLYIDKEDHSFIHNISNNQFNYNQLTCGGDEDDGYGGGMYIYSDNENEDYYQGLTYINDNSFYRNSNYDGYGGGLYVDWLGEHIELTVNNNSFSEHFEIYEGGGAYVEGLEYGGIFRFEDNTLSDNSCRTEVSSRNGAIQGSGGGLYVDWPSNASRNFISDNLFTNNRAYNDGGALFINSPQECQLSVGGNSFHNNSVNLRGGAVSVTNFSDTFDMQGETYYNNYFYNNQSLTDGGAMYYYGYGTEHYLAFQANNFTKNDAGRFGGGLYLEILGVLAFDANVFDDNTTAGVGGGIYLLEIDPEDVFGTSLSRQPRDGQDYGYRFTNNRIYDNYSEGSGGGIFMGQVFGNCSLFAGNMIYNNYAQQAGGGVLINRIMDGYLAFGGHSLDYQNDLYNNSDGYGGAQLYNDTGTTVDATYNYWGGGEPTNPGDVHGTVTTPPYSTTSLDD